LTYLTYGNPLQKLKVNSFYTYCQTYNTSDFYTTFYPKKSEKFLCDLVTKEGVFIFKTLILKEFLLKREMTKND